MINPSQPNQGEALVSHQPNRALSKSNFDYNLLILQHENATYKNNLFCDNFLLTLHFKVFHKQSFMPYMIPSIDTILNPQWDAKLFYSGLQICSFTE